MQRLRLYDIRMSRLPGLVGLCQNNVPAIANYVNSAQRRLIYAREAGEEGWWGTWAEIAFNVSRATPYITLPRDIARIQAVVVCESPIAIQNQFYEYLQFGNGRFPKHWSCGEPYLEGYSRNNAVTFLDIPSTPVYIAAYPTDAQDYSKRVLVQGYDQNGKVVYSQNDLGQTVTGEFLSLETPFVRSDNSFIAPLTGIQKDATVGPVQIYQVDPATGEQTLILTMAPGETTGLYRRYYFNGLPCNCCQSPDDETMVQVKALVKLELIPVVGDTDYCLIQNLEAIIEECQSVRYSEMDTPAAKQMSQERHIAAIRMLNGELNHYIGQQQVAMSQQVFGSARLERQRIGNLL